MTKKLDDGLGKLRARLREMVDLNNPVGLVRPDLLGIEPLAYGRLIEWTDEHLMVEELQIIGRAVKIGPRDEVQAFAGRSGDLVTFVSTVDRLSSPVKLNEKTVINAIRLEPPRRLAPGNRRTVYRAPLTLFEDAIDARVWFVDRAGLNAGSDERLVGSTLEAGEAPIEGGSQDLPCGGEDPASVNYYYTRLDLARSDEPLRGYAPAAPGTEPMAGVSPWTPVIREVCERQPHALARACDITSTGVGLLFYGCRGMQFKRFECVVIELGFDDGAMRLVGEVRQCKDVGSDRARVGFHLLCPGSTELRDPMRQRLEQKAIEMERLLLERKRREAG